MSNKYVLILLCSFCMAVNGYTQEDTTTEKTLGEVIVSVNKWEQKLNELPNKIVKVNRYDILKNNPQTAADLLGQTGTVFIQKSQLGGGSPMIRGFATNRVLLVIDGVRMNNAIYRSGNLQNVISIDALSTETAEVIFGPGSLIYGSDAIGGVMDFHTLDILTCRNLLIYLGADLQKKLFPLFHYSLKPGGTLFLGSAESIGNFGEFFSPLEAKARIYRREDAKLRAIDVDFPIRHTDNSPNLTLMPSPHMPPANLQTLADQLLLQKFSPAAVLTNAEGDVLFISGRTGKYLEPAAGKANWNIHAMARDGLRQELILALPKAHKGLRHNNPCHSNRAHKFKWL